MFVLIKTFSSEDMPPKIRRSILDLEVFNHGVFNEDNTEITSYVPSCVVEWNTSFKYDKPSTPIQIQADEVNDWLFKNGVVENESVMIRCIW